jgi:hypothetical protein
MANQLRFKPNGSPMIPLIHTSTKVLWSKSNQGDHDSLLPYKSQVTTLTTYCANSLLLEESGRRRIESCSRAMAASRSGSRHCSQRLSQLSPVILCKNLTAPRLTRAGPTGKPHIVVFESPARWPWMASVDKFCTYAMTRCSRVKVINASTAESCSSTLSDKIFSCWIRD